MEGAIVGYAQWFVLRHRMPRLWFWITATVAGGSSFWIQGMLPSTLASLFASSSPQVALAFDLQIESTGIRSGRSADLQIDDPFRLGLSLVSTRWATAI